MTHRISQADLLDQLPDILDRVHDDGEHFVVERDGAVLAITPVDGEPGITWTEIVTRLAEIPRPDDRFADDLEAIHAR